MFKIENLTRIYNTGDTQVKALDRVSIDIDTADIFGIIGMSGAGKSTLLRCMGMLDRPDEGSIEVDGVDVLSVTPRQLIEVRKQIGTVFQGYNLLMQKTVAKNIAFPLELSNTPKEEIRRRVAELLELVGLSDKAQSYPSQLSGGQKQRVAIARALAVNPKVLLCDEPTSALDSLTTRSILSLLREINQKYSVTIVIITHEIGVVRSICNKVAVIDNSVVVEQGETKAVLESPRSPVTKQLLLMGGDSL